MKKVILIAGSNNKNLEVIKEFEKDLNLKGIDTEVLDLVSLDLPLYTPVAESQGIPSKVTQLIDIMDSASGFVFSIPEYNGGVPPVVTSFIAWLSRSGDQDWRKLFNGKPAALASFSGSGGIQALISLRTQLSYIGLNTVGRQVRATFKDELNLDDIVGVNNQLIELMKL